MISTIILALFVNLGEELRFDYWLWWIVYIFMSQAHQAHALKLTSKRSSFNEFQDLGILNCLDLIGNLYNIKGVSHCNCNGSPLISSYNPWKLQCLFFFLPTPFIFEPSTGSLVDSTYFLFLCPPNKKDFQESSFREEPLLFSVAWFALCWIGSFKTKEWVNYYLSRLLSELPTLPISWQIEALLGNFRKILAIK